MNKQKLFFTIFGVVVVLVVVGLVWQSKRAGSPAQNDTAVRALAQCLKDGGATFYGAFWCPHCQDQKALFGSAAELLPYTECAPQDGNGQTQACADAKITSYPTWRFKDGSELKGAIALATLAEKTGCPPVPISN